MIVMMVKGCINVSGDGMGMIEDASMCSRSLVDVSMVEAASSGGEERRQRQEKEIISL